MTTKDEILAIVNKAKSELRGRLNDMATPIDFADLTARGVLRKSGGWYILEKPDELPQYAWAQAKSIARINNNGNEVVKLQFRDTTRRAKALLEKYSDL